MVADHFETISIKEKKNHLYNISAIKNMNACFCMVWAYHYFQKILWADEKSFRVTNYRKIPKYSDSRKIDVIILKFEQCGFTIE